MRRTRAHRPSLASRIQARLAGLYGVDAPDVDAFVRRSAKGREVLEVRENEDGIELALYLPSKAFARPEAQSLDVVCQVVEGVSHFVYVVERARRELPTTQLELELQAEVDKFVVLALATRREDGAIDLERVRALRERLFERVRFLHPEGTEPGDRYRLANRVAAQFATSLLHVLQGDARAPARMTSMLRRFFEAGLREKLEIARAA
jgi:hypothetical protein